MASAAPTSLTDILPDVVAELAALTVGPSASTLTALDNSVETHLVRIDEAAALIESVRREVAHTADTAFPMLLQNAQELAALFTVLDRAEESANRGLAAAKAAAERLDALQAGYDGQNPVGMAKLSAWFGNKARVAADAPVRLTPFDPASARIDAEAELAALRACVGVSAAVQVSQLKSFMAEGSADAGGLAASAAAEAEAARSGSFEAPFDDDEGDEPAGDDEAALLEVAAAAGAEAADAANAGAGTGEAES